MRLLLRAARVFAVLGCATLAWSSSAGAEDAREESRAAFRRGVQQLEANDYKSAKDSFAEAYRLFPHPSILLNLGIARAHNGEYLDAEQDLIRFLADDGGAPPNEIASAHAELAAVRQHLGTLRLRVAPSGATAQIDGRPVALIPGKLVDVRAVTGAHTLRVAAPGFDPMERRFAVDGGGTVNLDLSLAPRSGALHDREPDGASDGSDAVSRRTVAISLFGGGAVVAALGLASGLHAKSLADDYNTPNSGAFQDASTKSSGILFRTLADVCFASALVAGGVGVYLFATPPSAPASAPSSQARLVVGPAFSGVVGRF